MLAALVDLLGKPIAEASALCIPTAGYGGPYGDPGGPACSRPRHTSRSGGSSRPSQLRTTWSFSPFGSCAARPDLNRHATREPFRQDYAVPGSAEPDDQHAQRHRRHLTRARYGIGSQQAGLKSDHPQSLGPGSAARAWNRRCGRLE